MSQHTAAELHHALRGRYDALGALELEQQLKRILDGGAATILLDLSAITYLSSSAIRILLLAKRRATANGGNLVLVRVPPSILGTLRMAGLDRIFDLSP